MVTPLIQNLDSKVYFFQVNKGRNEIFSWKSKFAPKAFFNTDFFSKTTMKKDLFHHLNKGDIKMVGIKSQDNLIFTLGANSSIQFQILEALLEYLKDKFLEKYADIFSLEFGASSEKIFDDFIGTILDSLKGFEELDLIEVIEVYVDFLRKTLKIAVKRSLVKDAEGNVPFVFYYRGITILIYLDHNYDVRALEKVSFSN
ncbi:MAG: hypothetical protein ACOC35_01380 [Promethearchaeia archaeon]